MEKSIAEKFEDDIPNESMVVNVKLNLETEDDVKSLPIVDIKNYIKELGCEILFSSVGLHLNGENKVPHIHYHFITTQFHPPSNPSQHRKRWAKKNDASLTFLEASWKFHHKIDLTKPKYYILAYPLKEGNELKNHQKELYIYDNNPMIKEYLQFLKEIGNTIYQTQLALKLKQDKCEDRKKNALNELFKLCKENEHEFNTFREMVLWLDNNYIQKMELDEYPDPRHYKTNCQKIAVNLGKLKYSDII